MPSNAATGDIRSLWGNGGDLYIAFSKALMIYSHNEWFTVASPSIQNYVLAIWGDSGDNIYCVGMNGTIIRWRNPIEAPVDETPPSVIGTYPSNGVNDVPIYSISYVGLSYRPLTLHINFS